MKGSRRACFVVLKTAIGLMVVLLLILTYIDPHLVYYWKESTTAGLFIPSMPQPGRVRNHDVYTNITLPPSGFLVWSNSCRIRQIEPYTPNLLAVYKPILPMNCSYGERYVTKTFNNATRRYLLHLNVQLKTWFVGGDTDYVSCCFKEILRGVGPAADKIFRLLPCIQLQQDFVVPLHVDGAIVVCRSVSANKIVSQDAFSFVQERAEVRQRLRTAQNRTNSNRAHDREPAFGVLLLGIDSMSQINLRRTMPKTFDHLQRNEWFELSGYNKIDDNTFPNLMALLSGYNLTRANEMCRPTVVGGLDNCTTLFKELRQNGFVTAYAEDETPMNTFNYLRKGFSKPPTDFYLEPFMLAIEGTMPIKEQRGMKFCIGPKRAAEYIYDFGIEFATRFVGERAFGLFWTNSITHNSYDTASGMDARILEYLQELRARRILDHFVVVFFSDHGSRFGELRNMPQGFMEERLPAFFIWLPEHLRRRHPEFVYALKVNRHRLTSTYDMYLTLQQLLALTSNANILQLHAEGCPSCQSLLRPVAEDRNCEQAGIAEHWCSCSRYDAVSTYSPVMKDLTRLVISRINAFLQERSLTGKCLPLQLHILWEASKKVDETPKQAGTLYRVRFEVAPKITDYARFDATFVHYGNRHEILLDVASVSRLNTYAADSACISDTTSQKFCICRK